MLFDTYLAAVTEGDVDAFAAAVPSANWTKVHWKTTADQNLDSYDDAVVDAEDKLDTVGANDNRSLVVVVETARVQYETDPILDWDFDSLPFDATSLRSKSLVFDAKYPDFEKWVSGSCNLL